MSTPLTPAPAAPGDRFAAAAAAMTELMRLVAQLRAPGGCPWDAEQTLQSLVPFLLEEAHEAAAAGRQDDRPALCDELGDVLLQVVLQAEIAQETGSFDLAQITQQLSHKLVRRHPHVWAPPEARPQAKDVQGAQAAWDAVKATEAQAAGGSDAAVARPKSRLDGVPADLPALQRCQKIAHKAAKTGFDWPDVTGPLAKLDEEIGEIKEAMAQLTAARATGTQARQEAAQQALADEVGDALFSLVNLARHLDVSAEETLHRTIERFSARFHHVEAGLRARGLAAEPANLDLMGELWQQAKQNLASR